MSIRPVKGIPRGKIRPWDGSVISIRVELGQVARPNSAFVICRRSGVRQVRSMVCRSVLP
jgi:hypothetical protein